MHYNLAENYVDVSDHVGRLAIIYIDTGTIWLTGKGWTSKELEEITTVARWIQESRPCQK